MKVTIDYDGNTNGNLHVGSDIIKLIGDANYTNRLLPGMRNYQDVCDGDEYDAEWSAPGIRISGDKLAYDVEVYWIHTARKGEGALPEDYDWTEVDRIE